MLQQTKIFRFFSLSLFIILFLAGCANRSSEMISTDKLALAELNPQLRFDQEVMIVRLTQVLQEAKLTDSLGLWWVARYDFNQAISLNQKMTAAYNYMGLYLLLEDDYDSSVDAFNAVLDLDPDYAYTYLNRGLAFYYSGRYSEAQRDLLHFYNENPADPYRVLWLYFNELELTPQEAKNNLIARAKKISDEFWGKNVVDYFLGNISLKQLRKKMEAQAQSNMAAYAEMLTETYFYLAKQKLKLNQKDEAISLFRLALANQVFNFVEYRFALFELSQLRNNESINNVQTPTVVGDN